MARVLLLGSYAPSLANFRGPLLRHLVARGHELFAAAPPIDTDGSEASARLVSSLQQWGVKWLPIDFARNKIDPVGDARFVAKLAALLKRHRIERLITYSLKPNVYGAAAATIARVPSAAMVTGLGSFFLTPGPKRKIAVGLMRAAGRKHDRFFVQNEDDLQDLVSMGVAPRERFTRTMGSGVELDHFAVSPLPREPAVLMLARLVEFKGVREYMRAAALLREEFPRVPFRLAGMQDPDSAGIGLDEVKASEIEYLGRLDDVRGELARCSIYASPSWHEGTSRSALEAMACGRPIVTTNGRGSRESVWPGENGLRVPVRDARALANALAELLRDPARCQQMGTRSAALAREHYGADTVAAVIAGALGL